ncbi:hypothetical protein EI94DRAFT_1802289 [Lactarius quietus]|nr:hypothetical protein EI94DRAFT_1802289 [Lactarius quietus]
MASVFYYLTQTYGRVTTIRFFRAVVDLQGEREDLDWSHVRAQFEALAASDEIKGQVDVVRCVDRRHFRSLRGEDQQRSRVRSQAGHVYRLIAQWPHIYQWKVFRIRGRTYIQLLLCPTSTLASLVEQDFLASLQTSVGQALQYFQETGAITDEQADDTEKPFYDFPTTKKRRNRHVVPQGNGGVRIINLPDLHKLFPKGYQRLIHKDFLSKATPSRLLQVLGSRGDPGLKQEGQTVLNMASQLDEITGGVALANIDRDDYRRYVEEAGRMVAKTAGVAPGASGLIINGRMSFPFALSVLYQLLSHEYELVKRVQPVVLSALEDIVPGFYGLRPVSCDTESSEWLLNIPTITVEFRLLPLECSDLPLKRLYRYNLAICRHEFPAQVSFRDLPIEPIYTPRLDEPSSWLALPREALYDLDNAQLGVLSGDERQRGVEAVFEHDNIIVQLAAHHCKPIDDTLIAENLQFEATPGVFHLEIREREVFRLDSKGNEGWLSPSVEEAGSEGKVTSFEGVTPYPRLARLPGQEFADVLEDPEEEEPDPTGILMMPWRNIASVFKPSGSEVKDAVSTQRHAEVNIFTVASGLLYERFALIMILSVPRNMKHTVKFCSIENFLSPSFLEFIPHFAEEYDFQYGLVTYNLFLDVLFPMDVDKVIFVDADQIVRTDLKELIDLDFPGAPYGYTPMGNDKIEMESFRFWKTGHWETWVLTDWPRSALYIVDLVRFRQTAAGDILRSHFQQLSADSNSLANLDQDFRTTCKDTFLLFSQHEDWSLIVRFTRKLANEGCIHASAIAADVNELAKVGSVTVPVPVEETMQNPVAVEMELSSAPIRDELWP